MNAVRERIRQHWKITTFLFAVSFIECIIIVFYFSIELRQAPIVSKMQVNGHALFGITPSTALEPVEVKPTFRELFKDGSEIEKRLPKLLHGYFKEVASADFPPSELIGLLNIEMAQVKQFTLLPDSVVLHINPHQPMVDTGVKSIAIKKELLKTELRQEHLTSKSSSGKVTIDYEITAQPQPGNIIKPQEKMLALTFDDGPDGNTHALLDALDKYEANATFFVLGQKVAGGAGVLQRMVREGHEVGNHSWSHPDLRKLSPQQIHTQIADTQHAIKNATGIAPTQMRPPYGAVNPAVQQAIKQQGLAMAMWSVDSNDWRDRDPELLYQRIMSNAGDGKIILLHDIHLASVQAAIRAIPDLKAQGYQLVTLSQQNQYR